MYLSDSRIKKLIRKNPNMIFPFVTQSLVHEESNTSYGLSCCGYDLRLAQNVKVEDRTSYSTEPKFRLEYANKHIFLNKKEFVLAETLETVEIPENCVGFIRDKSSLARKGLSLFNTVIEPGFKGKITLEILNNLNTAQILTIGMGIAQLCLAKIDGKVEIPYSKRNNGKGGKYQNQSNIQEAL